MDRNILYILCLLFPALSNHPPMCRSLEVDSVLKSFGEQTILTDIYLKCCPGDIIALFGHNGTGKSTLLKIIFGSLKGDRNFIRIDEQVIKGPAFQSGLIAYLPQHPFLPSHLKVSEVVDLCIPPEDKKRFLGDKFLFRLRTSRICEISTGEKRYLEIKSILFNPAPYLLLDEPFNGISPVVAEELRAYIAESSRTRGIILSDHNFREVHKIANRITLLENGYLKEINNRNELIPYGYYQP